jgi:hypothetical protein
MTHKEVYNRIKKNAQERLRLSRILAEFEQSVFGFEFPETNSDIIIDTLNYGIADYSYENYIKEMNFYKKSFDISGGFNENGIYENNKNKKL